ncbi:MAG: hypothetical protein ACC656_08720 [Candidatus Heimdallarchaeota archaeon]
MKVKQSVMEEYERLKDVFSGSTEEIEEKLMDEGYRKTGVLSKISPFSWFKDIDFKRNYKGGRFQVRVKNNQVRLDYDLFDPDRVHELPVHLLYDTYQLAKSSLGMGRKNYIKFEY